MFSTKEGVKGSSESSPLRVSAPASEEPCSAEAVGVDEENIGEGPMARFLPGEIRRLYSSVCRAARSLAFWARYSGLCIY